MTKWTEILPRNITLNAERVTSKIGTFARLSGLYFLPALVFLSLTLGGSEVTWREYVIASILQSLTCIALFHQTSNDKERKLQNIITVAAALKRTRISTMQTINAPWALNLPPTLIMTLLLMTLSGCSILPYESEFQCPNKAGTGKCVSVDEAYEEALSPQAPTKNTSATQTGDEKKVSHHDAPPPSAPVNTLFEYEKAQFKRLAGLLREPQTPLVAQTKLVRTLILSYPDNPIMQTRLYMPRFVYTIAEQPQFVFGQYNLQQDMGVDFFKKLGAQ